METTQHSSIKGASVEALSNGMFRVGRGTHSIVRTINAANLERFRTTPGNWTSFKVS